MIEPVHAKPAPHVGARVRWHSHYGTNFGNVVSVDSEARTLVVQVEAGVRQDTLEIDAVTVLSKPGGG